MDSSVPGIACVMLIGVFFVIPMYAYILVSERRAKAERAKSIEAGRHEPVTIQPYIDPAVCMGSGACVTACPEHVLAVIEGQAIAVNMAACIGHGACVSACPVGAIELVFGSEKRGIDIPRVGPDFQTNVPGVYIAGELGGMGLIANAAEQGTRALANALEGVRSDPSMLDVAIVGAGPAGLAAAAAAKVAGRSYVLLEQDDFGGAVRHYPRKKLVFTRPMEISGYPRVNLRTLQKEALVDLFKDVIATLGIEVSAGERVDKVTARSGGFSLETTKRRVDAQRVILCLGRRGTPRKLGAVGEDQAKVAYSLLEPEHYSYDHLMVVGGGDSAVEAAIQLSEQAGNKVTLSYRGDKINRPKEKNIERLRDAQREGRVDVMLESEVKEVRKDRVVMDHKGEQVILANDYVFVMVGGVLPTKFLQAVGIQIEKHYGKRVEVADEGSEAPSAVPTRKDRAPELPPQVDAGNSEPTVSLPPIRPQQVIGPLAHAGPQVFEETTQELPPIDVDDLPMELELELDEPSEVRQAAAAPPELRALVRAAELRLAAGAFDEVVSIATQFAARVERIHADPGALDGVRFTMGLVEGEALLGRGNPGSAVGPLTEALGLVNAVSPDSAGRVRWALVRACMGDGDLERAADLVCDVLVDYRRGDPEFDEALLVGGRLAYDLGDLELAEARFTVASDDLRGRSAEGEARARHGQALVLAARSQLRPALRLLSDALALLGGESAPEVVAPILSDAIKLECALGRYSVAIGHAEVLLDWTVDRPVDRALASALLGEARAAVGSNPSALKAATAAAEACGKLGKGLATDAKLRTARLLCDLGRIKSARALLDAMGPLPESVMTDPAGQQLALRARVGATQDAESARQLASTAIARRGPLVPLAAVALRLDAARALLDSGNPLPARAAAKRGLKAVPGADPKGVRLALLVLLHETGPDDTQVVEAMSRTAQRVAGELTKADAASFRARSNLATAFEVQLAVGPDPETRPLAVPEVPR